MSEPTFTVRWTLTERLHASLTATALAELLDVDAAELAGADQARVDELIEQSGRDLADELATVEHQATYADATYRDDITVSPVVTEAEAEAGQADR